MAALESLRLSILATGLLVIDENQACEQFLGGTVNYGRRRPTGGSVQCPRVMVASTRENPPEEPSVHGGENEPTKQAQSLQRQCLVLRRRDGSRPAAEV